MTEDDRSEEGFSYLHPTPQVAEALARVIVAVNDRLGEETDPRVRALANLPRAS